MENRKLIKLGMVFLIILLSVNFVSAWEWDNVRTYDPVNKEFTIRNALGLPIIGSEIARIKLNTPLNYKVAVGYGKVAEFTINSYTDYDNALRMLNFYDVKNDMGEIQREFDYKYLTYEQVEIQDYSYKCSDVLSINGTIENICNQITVGSHIENREVWKDIGSNNITKGDITIGIFTSVEIGDKIDWVPTFFGEQLTEWATWTQDLNVGLISYYKLDEPSGTIAIDSVENFNGINDGATVNVAGKINKSYDFEATETDEITTDYTDGITGKPQTINAWINLESLGVDKAIISALTTTNGFSFNVRDDNKLMYRNRRKSPVAWFEFVGGTSFSVDTWYMVTLKRNDTRIELFLNGESEGVFAMAYDIGEDSLVSKGTIGSHGGQSRYFDGELDEVGIWNRALTQSEITQLYNSGTGISYFLGPNITIIFPQNIIYNETLSELNYSVDSADRCWNSIDGGITNSTDVSAGTNFTGLITTPLENNWTVYCNNSDRVGLGTVNFIINMTTNTELITPLNDSNFTITNVNFSINSTPINTNLTNVTLYLWHTNGSLSLTNTTLLSGNNIVQTTFNMTLHEENFLWNAETCGIDAGCSFATENRTLKIHTTPANIIINYPTGLTDFFRLGTNSTLNWTISETGQNLTQHILNCSYTYNEIEIPLNQSQCIETNETSFLYVNGVNNLSFKVTEKFGIISTNTTFWNYTILQINETFRNSTTEGALENFSTFIKLSPEESITSVGLIYNETTVTGTSSTIGENIKIEKNNLLIPSVEDDTNITFLWSVILSSGNIINLTTNTQEILNLKLDNCSSFTNRVLNLSLVDEEKQTALLNTTIKIGINLLSADRTIIANKFSGEFKDENPLGICLNTNVNNGVSYSMDAIIRYNADGYAIEYYNLIGQLLTNETATENIILYDINLTDSTEFQVNFKGTEFLPIEDALVFVERQYVSENAFKTVELPKTDSNGQTVIHLVRNDIIYNIRVIKDGIVLGNFLNIIAFCEDFTIGSCSINLDAISNISAIFNYDIGVGILYDSSPQYNPTTNIVSFDFVSSDGTPKVVSLNVEKRDIFGNRSICNNTVTSTSGTVLCNIGQNLSETSLISVISIDGQDWITESTIIDKTGYGNIGYVMWFFLSIGLFLMFSGTKNGIMFAILFSFIGAVAMGWSVGGIIGVGSAGIWILVIVMLGIWKINKGRAS